MASRKERHSFSCVMSGECWHVAHSARICNHALMCGRACRGKTNFFEKRVGEYQKAGVMSGLSGDMKNAMSFDEDF